jgi:transcription-repair coupling factor (superfamily II helicase)
VGVSGLLESFERLSPYRDLRAELTGGETPMALGLMQAARPAILAALACDLQRPMLVATGSVERAKALTRSLRDWLPADAVSPVRLLNFPEPLVAFYERAPWTEEVIADRLQVLFTLQPSALGAPAPASPPLVVASARALMQRTLPVRQFKSTARELRVGQLLDLEEALSRWTGLGYEPSSVVEAPGQFSHRGGILDIFPPADLLPVRIELFGSQVESLRRFDPATQRSQVRIERVVITPACEALPRYGPRAAEHVAAQMKQDLPTDVQEELEAHFRGLKSAMAFPGVQFYLPYFYTNPAALLDYLPQNGLLIVDDAVSLRETWSAIEKDVVEMRATLMEGDRLPPDYPRPYLTWDEWQDGLQDHTMLTLGHSAMEDAVASLLADCFVPDEHFGGQLKAVLDHVEAAQKAGDQVVVVSQQARRLAELWASEREYVLPVENLRQTPPGPLTFVKGALAEGWILRGFDLGHPFSTLRLLTDAEIFGWRRPVARRSRPRRRKAAPETYFSDLSPGDFVVHVEHGIGVFQGLVTRAMEGVGREYLLIEYAEDDRLYVPIHQADRISRYIGADARPPRINRLGGARWRRVKARAQEAAEEVAEELLELYAARELVPGHAFTSDTDWQAELEASFPYVETADQLRAIADVKADMEKPKPMDRLICGDVGYGKTEVALRAAFKAVMDGKQVAVLTPTTVLAQQHYATFRQRLAPFPVEVEMLSRFRTRSEQQAILERLYTGQVDIVIGTHRLLQKDVMFADLGLLVIDEEQRFGVTHKEFLKQMRTEVDVLTMTATPIPRTLYMSLTGVRDISTIETPPEERLPISTYTGQYDPALVQRAIRRELERGGQVFYLHNRVQTIRSTANRLRKLTPEAVFAVAHGQMREADLEETMMRFVVGEIDVLVCTSIIESGLDIPNANTLIVERADRFGLAQLYQLRGRVGRGSQRAYAYFFHGRVTRMTNEARQRLETMREASGLGAGYTIAMRDLEIRGAGDILGTRQSGQIAAVGFDLYTRLLAREVKVLRAKRKGEPPPPEPLGSIRIDLPLAVRLPDDYVPDTRLRLQLYRRLADLGSMAQIQEMEQELSDRFGPLPPSVENLMYQLRLKALARDARVSVIGVSRDRLELHSDGERFDTTAVRQALGRRVSVSGSRLWLPMGPDWRDDLIKVLKRLGHAAV